jgi:hypothetical protein
MSPWLFAIVVIMASDTVPMVVVKKPEWLHKNKPVKNIKQPEQADSIMRHDNTDLEPDKNKK